MLFIQNFKVIARDSQGNPYPGVKIFFESESPWNLKGYTDANGELRFSVLFLGSHSRTVNIIARLDFPGPGLTTYRETKTVTVPAPGEITVVFTIPVGGQAPSPGQTTKTASQSISVVVRAADGTPVAGAQVFFGRTPFESFMGQTDSNGTLTFTATVTYTDSYVERVVSVYIPGGPGGPPEYRDSRVVKIPTPGILVVNFTAPGALPTPGPTPWPTPTPEPITRWAIYLLAGLAGITVLALLLRGPSRRTVEEVRPRKFKRHIEEEEEV